MDKDSDIQEYIRCMEEIKLRVVSIGHFLKGKDLDEKFFTGHPITDIESICLQFRKVLELIAMASLCANREEYMEIRKKFHLDWHPERIMRDIERINPNFYPVPGTQILDKETGRPIEVRHKESGYLTRDEFVEAWKKCSEALHADNPYGASITDRNIEDWYLDFENWNHKIVELLNHHQIQLVDEESQWWIIMSDEKNGKVHFAEMQRK